MEKKQFIATRAAIVRNKKTLIIREAGAYEEGTNEGKWDFPGGRLDFDESVPGGLKREAKEESGLDVKIVKPFFVGEHRPVVKNVPLHVVAIYFLCSADHGEVKLGADHDEFKWITKDEAKRISSITLGSGGYMVLGFRRGAVKMQYNPCKRRYTVYRMKLSAVLYWLPRVVGVIWVLFISSFALDVFSGGEASVPIVTALLIHLLPVAMLVVVLAFAWRFEYVGGIAFLVVGLAPLILLSNLPLINALLAVPLFLIGALFILHAWYIQRDAQ